MGGAIPIKATVLSGDDIFEDAFCLSDGVCIGCGVGFYWLETSIRELQTSLSNLYGSGLDGLCVESDAAQMHPVFASCASFPMTDSRFEGLYRNTPNS